VPRNDKDNEIVRELSRSNFAWLGHTDVYVEGTFFTQSGESIEGTYTNFLAGQPNDFRGIEDGIQIIQDIGGVWNDTPCDRTVTFVCEIDEAVAESCSAAMPPPPSASPVASLLDAHCHGGDAGNAVLDNGDGSKCIMGFSERLGQSQVRPSARACTFARALESCARTTTAGAHRSNRAHNPQPALLPALLFVGRPAPFASLRVGARACWPSLQSQLGWRARLRCCDRRRGRALLARAARGWTVARHDALARRGG
jgi:hypothetical protein